MAAQSAQPIRSSRSHTAQAETGPRGAAIALVAALFGVAVYLFLARDVPRLDLLRATFAPASHADYALTLEQRVAPQRAVSQRTD